MKKKINLSILIIVFAMIVGFVGYYLHTGKSCRLSEKICLTSRQIKVSLGVREMGKNGEVLFGVGIENQAEETLIENEQTIREQWNFGDGLAQPIQEAAPQKILSYIATYTKEYTYTQPGTYTVSMQTLNDKNEVTHTSNTIQVTIPESAFSDVINNIQEKQDRLFLATHTEKELQLFNYNPATGETLSNKKISLEAELNQNNKLYSSGSNDAVQYNAKTGEIFFLTQGYSEFGGLNCTNNDGTCLSRIYKISTGQTTPTILFESEHLPANWVVSEYDNSLFFSFRNGNTQTIQKLNAENGTVLFIQEYALQKNTGLAELVVSADGSLIYQASKESKNGKSINETLRLRALNANNGELTETEIFETNSIDYGTTISPNNTWIAFYTNAAEAPQLTIWNIRGEQPLFLYPYTATTRGEISNMNLYWSGDSKHLFYMRADGIVSFDLATETNSFTTTTTPNEETAFVLTSDGAQHYMAYASPDGTISIYDTAKNETTVTPFTLRTTDGKRTVIAGIDWYTGE